jgi:hypothetical protein
MNWFLLAGSSSLSARFGTLLEKTALVTVVLRKLHRVAPVP